jgi:hypothetical protein
MKRGGAETGVLMIRFAGPFGKWWKRMFGQFLKLGCCGAVKLRGVSFG